MSSLAWWLLSVWRVLNTVTLCIISPDDKSTRFFFCNHLQLSPYSRESLLCAIIYHTCVWPLGVFNVNICNRLNHLSLCHVMCCCNTPQIWALTSHHCMIQHTKSHQESWKMIYHFGGYGCIWMISTVDVWKIIEPVFHFQKYHVIIQLSSLFTIDGQLKWAFINICLHSYLSWL